jgi:hypothetical protein
MSDQLLILLVGALGAIVAVLAAALSPWRPMPWLRQKLHIPPAAAWTQGQVAVDAAADAPSADQVYFTFAERLLDSQISTSDVLDTKAAGAIAVGSTVLPLTFGLLSISGRQLPGFTIVALGLAILAYIILLCTAARASHIRALEFRPDLITLWQNSQTSDGATLRRWVAEEYAASAEINRPLLVRKARYAGLANVALLIEGILIAFAAAASLYG